MMGRRATNRIFWMMVMMGQVHPYPAASRCKKSVRLEQWQEKKKYNHSNCLLPFNAIIETVHPKVPAASRSGK